MSRITASARCLSVLVLAVIGQGAQASPITQLAGVARGAQGLAVGIINSKFVPSSFVIVPDGGSTALLLGLGVVAMLGWHLRRSAA